MEIDKIYNEDCLVGMRDIPDKCIDLIITDPPYWHKKSPGKPYSQRKQCCTDSKFSNSALFNAGGYMMSSMSCFDGSDISSLLKECVRVCKIPNIYICCNETQLPYYAMWAESHQLMFTVLVWQKPLSIINKNRYSQNVEFIVRIYDYGTALNKLRLNSLYNRVQTFTPVNGKNKFHPTEKPVELFKTYILLSSCEGDLVLDPFMGSGTSAVACLKENRHFIGYEITKEYFDIAQERIKQEQSQLTLF